MQDSSALPLKSFLSKAKVQTKVTGKQRHVADAFRTICWFHQLRILTGAKTVYQMDALLEPDASIDGDAILTRKKKWREYRAGRNTPRPGLVAEIESRFSGSQHILEHPLWDALKLEVPAMPQIGRLIGRISADSYALLVSLLLPSERPEPAKSNLFNSRIRLLEIHGSLDSLACLILLMRRASDTGDIELTQKLSTTIDRTLIASATWFWSHGIALPIAEYVENVLIDAVLPDQFKKIYDAQKYLKTICLLMKETHEKNALGSQHLNHSYTSQMGLLELFGFLRGNDIVKK